MYRLIYLLSILPCVAEAAPRTAAILVGTTATKVSRSANSRAMTLQNRGPNPIYCAFSADMATETHGWKIAADGTLSVTDGATMWCVCPAGNQTLGAHTVLLEV